MNPSLAVKSVKELIAYAKARPGELNHSIGGIGGGGIRESIRAINSLKLRDADLRKLYYANAIEMLRLDLPASAIRKAKPARIKKRKR